jgi:hypothetical protein
MGDPVTMAVVGGTIGAAMNPKDPLKGAMLGAVGGYGGGAMLGAGAATTGAAATGGGFAGGGYGSVGLAGQTALQGAGSSAGGAGSGLFGNTMMGIGRDFGALQSFAQQNPVLAQQGLGMASNLMQTPQVQMAPSAGLMRGQMMQQQPMQFDMQAPQISLI